jgi:hypothetical protein
MAGFIIGQLIALDVLSMSKSEMPYTTTDIGFAFRLDQFSMLSGLLGAGLGGVIAIITKQYMFATGIILIWILGCFIGVVNWVLNGFPAMLNILLAGTGLEFVSYVAETIMLVFFFMFLASLLSQRPDLT